MRRAFRVLIAALGLTITLPAAAQTGADAARTTVRAYLDCRDGCDADFLVSELAWVDWTRERLDADFHLLIVSIATGAGGRRHDLVAVGQGRHAGRVDTITVVTEPNDSPVAIRRQLLRAIAQLLLAPAGDGSLGRYLTVTYAPPAGTRPARDRWDFWVFRAGAQGSYHEDTGTRLTSLASSLDADRTTPEWKVRIGADLQHVEYRFRGGLPVARELSRRSWTGDAFVARSIGTHWSIGGGASVVGDETRNLTQATRVAGVVEWDLFPYEEFQRRRFTVLYSVGARASRYAERTWYDEDAETRPLQTVDVTFNTRQLWGDARLSLQGEQDLADPALYRANVVGLASLNFGRHVSLFVTAAARRDRALRSRPRGLMTGEDVLRQRQQLFRQYLFSAQFGVTYRFGALYNAIVNPRFEGLRLPGS